MTDAGEEARVDLGDRRQYGRVVVAMAAAVTLVLAAVALPAVVGNGAVPALSLVPLEQADAAGGAAGAAADAAGASGAADAASGAGAVGSAGDAGAADGVTNLSGSQLGALSSASSTQIGGQTAPGGGESPLRNQSTEVHFVVESERPAYWRTGAYGEYTGQGFQRAESTQPFDGTVQPGPLRGERVAYEVQLRRSATALPTVWRPARVDAPAGTRLAAGTSLSSSGVPAGTSYGGVSYAPAREPAVLRAAGRSYPDAVREQYLGLPDDPDTERVAAFTDELTSDAETPYATAVAVERWLEANREYSLSATHDPADGTVASQFLFEMSAGYCEYFAATMTAMLRTQGVPARYVVGYSTGQRTAPGEYTVRAMNAHAWVEVYFPEVGWVQFDPTPGRSRLATEQRAFANGTGQPAAAYAPTEAGSPGESFSPDRVNTDGERPVRGGTAGGAQSPPDGTVQTANGVRGNDTAGDNATGAGTGTVDGGDAVTGTPPTGDGTVTGDGVSTGDETATGDSTAVGGGTATGDFSDTDTGSSNGTATDRTATAGEGTATDDETAGDETATDGETTGDETTTDGETTGDETTTDDTTERPALRADLNRTAVPGATVAVTVTRAGEPVVARVSFNGAPIGVTNASGVVVGTVPYASELNVTVVPQSRGALASGGGTLGVVGATTGVVTAENDTGTNSTTYTLDTRASVSVVGSVRSGRQVTVVAAVSDVPVRGGAVVLDGSRVARTDRQGRATVRLPTEPGTYTLGVRRGPVTGNRSVTIHRLNLTSEVGLPLAVPFAPVTVTATLNGEPVDGATVQRGTATLGETGPNGRVTTTLPARDRTTFVAQAGGQRAATAVTGVLWTTAAVGAGLFVVVGVVATGSRRLGVGPTTVWRRLRRVTAAAARATLRGVLWVADAVDRAGDALVRLVADLLAQRLAFRQLPGRLARLLAAAAAGLAAAVVAALTRMRAALGTPESAHTDTTPAAGRDDAVGDQSPSPRRAIRAAWRQFVAGLSVRQPRTKTPGELARWAVDRDGLPAEPVRRLRDGYRAVEYGAAEPSRYVDRVQEALASVRETLTGVREASADVRGDADATAGTDTDTRDETEGES